MSEQLVYHTHEGGAHTHVKPEIEHPKSLDVGNGIKVPTDGTPPIMPQKPKPEVIATWKTTDFDAKKRAEIRSRVGKIKKEAIKRASKKKEHHQMRWIGACGVVLGLSCICCAVLAGVQAKQIIEDIQRSLNQTPLLIPRSKDQPAASEYFALSTSTRCNISQN